MKRKLCVLGSTGSVGSNTLNIIRENLDRFEVVSLSAGTSVEALAKQIEEFKPEYASVATEDAARSLRRLLPKDFRVKVFYGVEGHRLAVENSQPDVVISAMMGTHGLRASLQAVQQGVSILGIANKEILVMAGTFILDAIKSSPTTKLIPVDSEHSAIFQALMGNKIEDVSSIILTGSGGPFRLREIETFGDITREEALKHPNWIMGSKITIDSATMMNKGLEFIEAIRLFGLPSEKVRIIIHPESVVHSLVEYCDGSLMAQLGVSDMRIPISLALAYPDRLPLNLGRALDLVAWGKLHFESPNYEKFPCLKLAIESEKMGPQGAIVLNAANEIAVEAFLKNEIRFVEIADWVGEALALFSSEIVTSLDDAIELDLRVKSWKLPRPKPRVGNQQPFSGLSLSGL